MRADASQVRGCGCLWVPARTCGRAGVTQACTFCFAARRRQVMAMVWLKVPGTVYRLGVSVSRVLTNRCRVSLGVLVARLFVLS